MLTNAEGIVNKLAAYGLAGIVGTLFHYLTLYVFVEFAGVGVLSATGVGFVVGAVINHELNRRYVFRGAGGRYAETAVRFFGIAVLGFCLNMLAMYVLHSLMHVYYLLAQLIATAGVFLVTFVLNKSWTFKA
ncbi:GtrA family protein [Marinobacter sp. NSM]|uniref:GtrA family protein n=1 Tax=Marinobacter sp. NSM TaxID=3458004 RepID=UPI0040368B97